MPSASHSSSSGEDDQRGLHGLHVWLLGLSVFIFSQEDNFSRCFQKELLKYEETVFLSSESQGRKTIGKAESFYLGTRS